MPAGRRFLFWVIGSLVALPVPHPALAADLAEPPVASFAALDDRFEGPDTLPSGLITIQLHNHGREPHQLQLLKLADGRTPEEFAAFVHRSRGKPPQWARHMGGPNGVNPGESAAAVLSLEPGTYIMTCALPGREDESHVVLTQPKALYVLSGPAPPQDFHANVHMAMFDYEFVMIEDLHRGAQTFYVVNRGRQTHQVSLVQLNEDASADDILQAFGPGGTGSIPGRLLGGMAGLEPGGRGMFTASLSPGRYAMMCLFPDPSSPDGHAARGMVMPFTIP
jgi:hypothetical protein